MAIPESSAVRAIRILGAVVVALAAWMFAVMPVSPVRAGVDGIAGAVVSFELASTPAHVFDVLGPPDDPRRAAAVAGMDAGNRIDFAFMVAYPALCAAISALLVARGLAPVAVFPVTVALAFVMAAGDLVENLQLLALSQVVDEAAMLPLLAKLRAATTVKWGAIFATVLLQAVFVWRSPGAWRWCALPLGAAGVAGFAGAAWRPGVEHAANLMALGWIATWVHALRWRART